jgi:predicted dehydrogenase
VLGVGAWGEKHARVYDALPNATLVGVHDRDPERARRVAERHRCEVYRSADDLIAQCEAVSIAVPTVSHREVFERAAVAGRHALVEKPLASSVEDADAMLATARRSGVRLQVGQVERFNPALIAAAPHIRAPKFIEAHRLALFQPRSLDIDVVFDLMIHDIDAVLDRVGALPSAISAVGVAVLSENEDIANARLEFPDGCVANLTASRVSQERLRRIRFFQLDAYLSVDLLEKTCEMVRVGAAGRDAASRDAAPADPRMALAAGLPPGFPPITRAPLAVVEAEPLTLELEAFLASIAGEGAGAAGGEAGREALRVAAEVRAAMKERARQWTQRASAVS